MSPRSSFDRLRMSGQRASDARCLTQHETLRAGGLSACYPRVVVTGAGWRETLRQAQGDGNGHRHSERSEESDESQEPDRSEEPQREAAFSGAGVLQIGCFALSVGNAGPVGSAGNGLGDVPRHSLVEDGRDYVVLMKLPF
jgi:hypothetical protein